jgi:uncharacterized membrane protein SpoIIM required for sporulation
MDAWTSRLWMVVSVFIGGFITWIVSYIYYLKASKDLRKEASQLRSASKMILDSLERMRIIEYTHDESGNINGFKSLFIHDSQHRQTSDEVKLVAHPPNNGHNDIHEGS